MSPRAIAGSSNDSTCGDALGERRPRLLRPFGVLSLHRSTVMHAALSADARNERAPNCDSRSPASAHRIHQAYLRASSGLVRTVALTEGVGVWLAGRPALVVELDVVDAGREGARVPLVGEGREER